MVIFMQLLSKSQNEYVLRQNRHQSKLNGVKITGVFTLRYECKTYSIWFKPFTTY